MQTISIPGSTTKFKVIGQAEQNKIKNCHTLCFGPDKDNPIKGHYYMRGAVVWPSGLLRGFAIVAGQHIHSKKIVLFEQWAFEAIDNEIREKDGKNVVIKGFARTANNFFWKYGCDRYFYGGDDKDEMHKRYHLQLCRISHIKKRVLLVNVPYSDNEANIDSLIAEYSRKKLLLIEPETPVHYSLNAIRSTNLLSPGQAAEIYDEDNDKKKAVSTAAVECIRVLVAGFHRMPWREPVFGEPETKTFTKDQVMIW